MKVEDNKIYTYIINDKLQMEKVMEDYNNYIYTIIRKSYINLPNEDIEEVALDVFLTLWKNQAKLDISKSMSPYISGITRNLIKYKYRQYKENQNIEEYEDELVDASNMEMVVSQNERQKAILEELEKLKEIDKEVFIEYYYHEKSIKDISKTFNISEAKIKSKLFRARKKLSKILKRRGYSSNGQ